MPTHLHHVALRCCSCSYDSLLVVSIAMRRDERLAKELELVTKCRNANIRSGVVVKKVRDLAQQCALRWRWARDLVQLTWCVALIDARTCVQGTTTMQDRPDTQHLHFLCAHVQPSSPCAGSARHAQLFVQTELKCASLSAATPLFPPSLQSSLRKRAQSELYNAYALPQVSRKHTFSTVAS